jgi:hypothetical protein
LLESAIAQPQTTFDPCPIQACAFTMAIAVRFSS